MSADSWPLSCISEFEGLLTSLLTGLSLSQSALLCCLLQGPTHKECIASPSPYQPSVPREEHPVRIRVQQYPLEMPETLHTRCRSKGSAICHSTSGQWA